MERRAFISSLAAVGAVPVFADVAEASPASGDLALHERLMRLAIAEAKRNPARPFGCVIVDTQSGNVVARGANDVPANPTFHGEMVALDDYVGKRGNRGWSELTLYTTAEPCAMCSAAIAWAGIPRVVYATSTPAISKYVDQISIRTSEVFAASPFYHNRLLLGGILASETDPLFRAMSER